MLYNELGEMLIDSTDIARCFSLLWTSLMSSNWQGTQQQCDKLRSLFPQQIHEEDVSLLTSIPTAEEILRTIKGLNIWKCPGPDGMNGAFYKSTWTTTGPDVIKFIQDFFSGKTHDFKSLFQIRHMNDLNYREPTMNINAVEVIPGFCWGWRVWRSPNTEDIEVKRIYLD